MCGWGVVGVVGNVYICLVFNQLKYNFMGITKLERTFDGKGEVVGYRFECLDERPSGYLYEVKGENGDKHYEVFLKKSVPICLDFENRVYSETEFKEVYPKAKDFGVWAWSVQTCYRGMEILETL